MPNFRRNLAVQVTTPGGDNPLLLTLVGNPPFYHGVAVSGVALQGRGGTPPYAYSIISGSLPTGLSLNGITGAITGTPTTVGHYAFVAEVQDSASNVYPHSFAMDILPQLFVIAGTPTPGEIAVAYTYRFVVSDGSGTHLTSGYSLASGTIPAGLTLHSNGFLDGTPTAPDGISYFSVSATNGTDTIVFPVQVTIYPEVEISFLEDRDPPVGWGGGAGTWLPSMISETSYVAHIVITGGVRPYTLNASTIDPLPTGIKVDSGARNIHGIPTDPATPDPVLIAVSVTDGLGGFFLVQRAAFIIDSQQGRVTPKNNGVGVGPNGAINYNFADTASLTWNLTSDGDTLQISATAVGGGGSSIDSINGLGPDSGGNISLVSHDGSVTITPDSHGDINFHASTGTVTNVSSGGLSPLFTVNITNPTTTPAFGFTAVNQNANLIYAGPATGAAAAPTFRSLVTADFPASGVSANTYTLATVTVDATGRITSASNGSAQATIQFKDEGSNLGASGTADTVDFVGAGVSASRVSNVVTVNIPGITSDQAAVFAGGTGEDGNCNLDGVNTFPWATLVGTVYSQTRNVAIDELRISTGVTLVPAAFHIWIRKWTCTSGFYGYIDVSGTAGGNASLGTGGASAARRFGTNQYFALCPVQATNGASGAIGNGVASTAVAANGNSFGGSGSRGAQAGNGSTGTGAQGGTAGVASGYQPSANLFAYLYQFDNSTRLVAGLSGTGGGSAGGDGSNAGGSGGAGGNGGGGIDISIGEIVTDGSTPAAMVNAKGGNGGNGSARSAGNVGGGSGGGGGGGGFIRAVVGFHTGASVAAFFDASGGTGGNGAVKFGTGTDGQGADGAESGRVVVYHINTGIASIANLVAGSAHSTLTGGAGGAAQITLA